MPKPPVDFGFCASCGVKNSHSATRCHACGEALSWAIVNTKPAPPPKEWYYTKAGAKVGPVTEQQIIQLAVDGVIRRHTLIWKNGMQDWQALGISPLADLCDKSSVPPPLADVPANDGLAWILAFWPMFFGMIFYGFVEYYPGPVNIQLLCFAAGATTVILAMCDLSYLKSIGKDIDGLGCLAVFLVPAYLFMRAGRVQGSNAYAWVFIITAFVLPVLAALTFAILLNRPIVIFSRP